MRKIAAMALLLTACGSPPQAVVPATTDSAMTAPAKGEGATDHAPRLHVAVSVDWEGTELLPANLQAIREFHVALPDVPLTHFLNAAYFTKRDADAAATAAAIRSALRPTDELGLHVHCWRSLVEQAGIAFRRRPTFWGERYPLSVIAADMGHEVELEAYSVEEIRAIVRESLDLLTEHGFEIGRSFRAGGWMAGPQVLQAIASEGLTIDSSATDASWHDELDGYALPVRIRELWPHVSRTSAPFRIATPAGPILEMPDTGALADYTTRAEITQHLLRGVDRLDDRDVFVHVGFHQETAARYADRVIEAIQTIRTRCGQRVVFETLWDSATAARASSGPVHAAAPAEPDQRQDRQ